MLSLADTAFVSPLGASAVAALGVNTSLFTLALFSFNFLSSATTPLVAGALAAGDPPAAGRVTLEALAAAAVAGVAVAAGLFYGAHSAVDAMGAADAGGNVAPLAIAYLQWRAPAVPAALLATVGAGVLRGLQDVRTPLAITLASNAAHAILAPLLMFGPPAMGIQGAGAACLVAEWGGAAAYAAALWRARDRIGCAAGLPPLSPAGAAADFLPFVKAGAAVAARTALLLTAKTAAAAAATRLGPAPAAAHTVVMQLWLLASFAVDALAVAGQALVADALGRDDPDNARAVSERLIVLGVAAGIALSMALLATASPIERSLSGGDADVAAAIARLIPIMAAILPLNAAVYTLDGILLGAGDFAFLAGAMGVAAAGSVTTLHFIAPGSLDGVWAGLVALMAGRALTLGVRFASAEGPLPPRRKVSKIE